MGYDANVFPSSIPNVSFVIQGKNNIYDPRHDTYGYTTNAALCIADFMCLPYTQGGFGLTMGTDISATQLSWAANICDSLVTLAAGGTAPAYTCNAIIQLTETRGSILQKMLTSCAGRLSYQGGQFSIFPGAWVTPTLQLTEADLMGPISWKPRMSVRDACNAVKGTYCSPENDWQTGDIPAYMSDALHGFVSDLWLAEDRGERIFRDVNFPCTVTSAEAQRLAKIEMMRSRYQGRGTIRCSMKAYQAVALDIIQLTHPRYTWLNKNLEVLSSRFTLNPSGEVNGVELDVAETDPAIYNWTATEQLTPQGYKQPTNVGVMVCSRPEGVLVYSGPGTVISGVTYPSTITTGADGRIQNSLYVAWTAPNDANVVSGGHLEIQWQQNGAPIWTAWGKLDPSSTHSFIAPVSDGVAYNVQVRAVNCAGVPSPWVLVGPVTVSNALSTIVYSGVDVAPAGTLTAQGLLAGGAQITVFTFAATVGSASVGCTPSPAVITGLNQSQNYYVYYIDPTFAGGTITPIATQNTADFLDRAGYFLIGQIVTPSYSPRYSPSTYSDIGSNTSTNPAAAYDSNITTDAIVTGIWWTSATVDPYTHLPVFSYLNASGNCIWSGFPNIVTSSVKTLNVVASASVNSATAATCYIGATVAGTGCGLVTLTATTAETTYTLTIPSGTNLSTISVNASASVAVGTSSTSPSSGTCTIQGFEIFIQ
jgi:hypothetical protein